MTLQPLRTAFLALLLAGLAGCASPTLDADSPDDWSRSVQAVRDDLDAGQRTRFDDALVRLAPTAADGAASAAASTPNRALHGLGADEVIRRAYEGQAEQAREGSQAAAQEIARLEALKAQVEAEQGQVEGFRITRAEYSKQPLGDTGVTEPFLRVSLDNRSELHVTRLTAWGTLRSPGRDQPWLRQLVSFEVFGGMPPGKQHETILRPGAYSEWGAEGVPADAQLDLALVSVQTADGRTWLARQAFTAEDARQLRELKAVQR
ncbi:hypothetical protein [Arenimonas sp. MALMAid1274]|uniref:hypothetical protein n=1 Tax=Arenimonas sp. MALMAid1274 TaxID=3411630 RepID=UPI003BA19591